MLTSSHHSAASKKPNATIAGVKRGMQQLSDEQKLEAIARVNQGETKAAVARHFGVPESTLRGWCKKAKIASQFVDNSSRKMPGSMNRSSLSPTSSTNEEMYTKDCTMGAKCNSSDGHWHEDESDGMVSSNVKGLEDRLLWQWLKKEKDQHLQAQQPLVTSSSCYNERNTRNKSGWFYNWCKTNPLAESSTDEPLALIVPSQRRILDGSNGTKIPQQQPITVEEALKHGEMFVRWLQQCSDPNVSVLQAVQIATLIKNIHSSLERNQHR